MHYIIIVPHGWCEATSLRHCDRRALLEARRLEQIIKNNGQSYSFFMADRRRSQLDHNRRAARGSSLRNKIISKIRSIEGDVIVFEVHSFPTGYPDFDFGEYDAGFLTLPLPKYVAKQKKLSELLTQNGFPHKWYPCPESKLPLDLLIHIEELNKPNLSHFMIECREYGEINRKSLYSKMVHGSAEYNKYHSSNLMNLLFKYGTAVHNLNIKGGSGEGFDPRWIVLVLVLLL